MSHLVHLLLKQKSKKRSETSLHLEAVQSAVDIYNSAVKSMQKNHRLNRLPEYFNIQENINQEIAAQLTLMLTEVNLLEREQYEAVKNRLENWLPESDHEQWKCDAVKKLLLSLLPAARQKQQLEQICLQYKAHLKERIEPALSEQFPQEYSSYCRPHVEWMGVRGQDSQPRGVEAGDMDFFTTHQTRQLLIKDEHLELAIQKYKAVSILQQTLQSKKTAPAQLEDFSRQMDSYRNLIEIRRDRPGTIFLKMIATIFSLGAAALAGIWSVRGREALKKARNILGNTAGMLRARPLGEASYFNSP